MIKKEIPLTKEQLLEIAAKYPTPFHIYDEKGIIENGEVLKNTFEGFYGFKEFFAVKACPNFAILRIMRKLGFGFEHHKMALTRIYHSCTVNLDLLRRRDL